MPRILETRRLTPVTKYFRIDAPLIAASAKPGQFVMLRVREGGERIPITIADYDRAAGTLTMMTRRPRRREPETCCAKPVFAKRSTQVDTPSSAGILP